MLPACDTALFTFRVDGTASIERQSDRALDQLRTLIMALDLAPGSGIDEAGLRQRLQCGRTPLREAIYRLAEERLLVIMPHRSVAVAPITINDLQQIYEARIYLESAAARLAAQRVTPEQLAWFQEREDLLASLSESLDLAVFQRWAASHFEFHYLLARASGNEYLTDSIRRVMPAAMRLNFFLFRHGAMATDRARNHAAIVKALKERDPDAAEEAIRRHISGAKERLLRLL